MSLSPAQLRAARALLNWSRAELAKHSGVSEPTIHRFENGVNDPESRTIEKVRGIFEKHGVEFTDSQGVRFRQKNIEEFDGAERIDAFYDYMYTELLLNGGEVCGYTYDEMVLRKHRKDPNIHRRRMKELFDKKHISVRILATKSDWETYGYMQIKRPLHQSSAPIGYYVFGQCLALVSYVDEAAPYVVAIRSGPIAEGYRQMFNIAWAQAMQIAAPTKEDS